MTTTQELIKMNRFRKYNLSGEELEICRIYHQAVVFYKRAKSSDRKLCCFDCGIEFMNGNPMIKFSNFICGKNRNIKQQENKHFNLHGIYGKHKQYNYSHPLCFIKHHTVECDDNE
jgi:hypothetical protein